MKSKKKLLLLGVGAMGALAMGVGATSTFAWYQAAQASVSGKTAESYSLTTAGSTLEVADLQLEVTVAGGNNLSETTKDGYTYVVYQNGTVARATPSGDLFATATVSYEFAKYTLTEDESIQSKTYYTKSGTSPNVAYTPVANPEVDNINTYYERAVAQAADIAKLADQSINMWLVAGSRTRLIAADKAPAGQSQPQWAAKTGTGTFMTDSGLAGYLQFTIAISGGVDSWSGAHTGVYSFCGEATEKTAAEVEGMTVGTHQNDGTDGSGIAAASKTLSVQFTDPSNP